MLLKQRAQYFRAQYFGPLRKLVSAAFPIRRCGGVEHAGMSLWFGLKAGSKGTGVTGGGCSGSWSLGQELDKTHKQRKERIKQ